MVGFRDLRRYFFGSNALQRFKPTYATNADPSLFPAIYACVSLLSQTLARATFEPTVTSVSSLQWAQLYWQWILNGDGYALIRSRSPLRIYPVYVQRSEVALAQRRLSDGTLIEQGDIIRHYVYPHLAKTTGPATMIAPDRSFISLHWNGYDGLESISPSDILKQPSDLINAVTAYVIGVSRNQPVGYVEIKKDDAGMEDEAQAEDFASDKLGSRTVAYPPGLSRGEPLDPMKIELHQTKRAVVEEVCRVFGVPPAAIGHYMSGQRTDTPPTFAYPRHVVRERARFIEEELSIKLGTAYRLDLEKVEQSAYETEARVAGELHANFGVITVNEARERIGLPPVPDGDRLTAPKGAPTPAPGGATPAQTAP